MQRGAKAAKDETQTASIRTGFMASGRLFASLALLAAIAIGVSACGRRGPLDTPYEAAVEAREEAIERGETPPPEPTAPVADRPFILDSLL
jgi:predicted small lipoprotein YifL